MRCKCGCGDSTGTSFKQSFFRINQEFDMGKASRMKKVNRMAMESRPASKAEASRQARERRDEAVNQHNESFETTMEKFKALSGDASVILIDNGVHYVGKEQTRAAFDSWVCNELVRDDPLRLGAIASIGSLMNLSIWDARLKVVDQTTGESQYKNPLFASFLLDKEKCFAWLLDHAISNPERGDELMAELLAKVIPLRNQFDLNSARWASAKLLIKAVFEVIDDDMLEDFVSMVNRTGSRTDPVGALANECMAKRQSDAENEELESSTPIPDDDLLVVANPHAIELGLEAENDAIFSGKSRTHAGSTAKRL
jgi:hypothetical protein